MARVLKEITPKTEDYSQWYVDVVTKADLMDYAPIKGFMVIKPYGYRIWELIQQYLDAQFKATGHQNAYFPLLIPENLLTQEARHVEGFSPEVAWVTQGGQETLSERLAIRPTSETIIGSMYSRWVQSYRDLPVLINQWCNVVRWEKATRPFLRTTEFLWQEGHTVHRTEAEAIEETRRMWNIYRTTLEQVLAIPVVMGVKSPAQRFAGALETYTLEALMGDGRALQTATSHFLGQNFSQAFAIRFLDEDGQEKYGWTTSWGCSTRLIGALIMAHGDDRGLRLPPRVAPTQVVIVPIGTGADRQRVCQMAHLIADQMADYRVVVDDRSEFTPGWKFNDWEMRGVPLRMELGPRDLARDQVVLVRRDTGTKLTVARDQINRQVPELLDAIQQSLFDQAQEFQLQWSFAVDDWNQIVERGSRGFFWADWCGKAACEEAVQTRTGATLRCIPEGQSASSACLVCHQPGTIRAVFARAY